MQPKTTVIKLIIGTEQEAQGVCAGKDNLHTAGCKNVGKQCCAFDEVFHERYFIDEDILVPLLLQDFQILVQLSKVVFCCDLNERSLLHSGIAHIGNNLADQRGLSGSAKTVQDKHAIVAVPINIVTKVLIATALFVVADATGIGPQRIANPNIGYEILLLRYLFLGYFLL